MFRLRMRLVHLLLIALLGLLALPLAASAQGKAEPARACTNGGYLNYTNAQGQVFANEGECVQYVAQGNTPQPVVTEDPAVTRCKQEAIAAGFNPGTFNIIAGTEGNDQFTPTGGADLICGFEGADSVATFSLSADDVFLGGDGNDGVHNVYGIFNGGAGHDHVHNVYGIFNGGDGSDNANYLYGTFNGGADNDHTYSVESGGIFNGGDGHDYVPSVYGTFNGGPGNDYVQGVNYGTFNGGAGDDNITWALNYGTFDGGDGIDSWCNYRNYGVLISVEVDACAA